MSLVSTLPKVHHSMGWIILVETFGKKLDGSSRMSFYDQLDIVLKSLTADRIPDDENVDGPLRVQFDCRVCDDNFFQQ